MKIFAGMAAVTIAISLSGCVAPPQQPVDLASTALSASNGRVGVAMTALPKVDTHLPGAGCLLCLAAASVANSALTSHAKTLPYEDLPKLKNDIANVLRKKGLDVAVIEENLDVNALPDFSGTGPNVAKKDFSSLQKKHNVEKLLVINIGTLGMLRNYSGYIPTSDPKAVIQGVGYLVNLKTNGYEWYFPVDISKSSDGKWDEPPKFPGLTNAYFQVLELGKDQLLKPLSQ